MAGRSQASRTLQSGQPYSVIDYSGAVGSIFYGTSDGITNPIVPLPPAALRERDDRGERRRFRRRQPRGPPLSSASCFTLPLLNPGDLSGAIPAGDTFETNFIDKASATSSGSPGSGARISRIVKNTQMTERFP